MTVEIPPTLQNSLARMAAQQGRDQTELVLEALQTLVNHDRWFRGQVEQGLEQLDAGQTRSHQEVGARLEDVLSRSRTAA